MQVNRQIVISSFLIIAVGFYSSFVMKKTTTYRTTITRIMVGGSLLALVAAIVDMISPQAGQLAGGLMWLALFSAALTILPDLFSRIAGR